MAPARRWGEQIWLTGPSGPPKFTTGVKYKFHQGFWPDRRSANPNHLPPPLHFMLSYYFQTPCYPLRYGFCLYGCKSCTSLVQSANKMAVPFNEGLWYCTFPFRVKCKCLLWSMIRNKNKHPDRLAGLPFHQAFQDAGVILDLNIFIPSSLIQKKWRLCMSSIQQFPNLFSPNN